MPLDFSLGALGAKEKDRARGLLVVGNVRKGSPAHISDPRSIAAKTPGRGRSPSGKRRLAGDDAAMRLRPGWLYHRDEKEATAREYNAITPRRR